MIALNGMLLVLALTEWHWPWPLAVLFALAVPMALGAAHGLLITRFNMQPFIVTLCGLLLYRGIARFIANDTTKGFGDAEGFKTLQQLANGDLFGLPMPFVLLIGISIVMWVVLHRSIYGRYLFAVGRNEQAARFSGHQHAPGHRQELCSGGTADRRFGNSVRILHQFRLAFDAWKFL